MKKEKNSKILVIVALALTTVALTLGFAAFSTTLNISSNATVTPDEADFKITIYGMKDEDAANIFSENMTFVNENLSTTTSVPPTFDSNEISAQPAEIDNTNYTISNIKATFANPSNEVVYYFVIKNEGKYDAYLDLSKYTNEDGQFFLKNQGTCTAESDASQELLDAACPYITNSIVISNSEGELVLADNNIVKIAKEDYIAMVCVIGYTDTEHRVDGKFSVEFPNETLTFSTTK